MKNILAFGDSLTWGFVAGKLERHPFEIRWPNALAAGLGGKARVIEEGHNGRTTVFDDPTTFDDRNGAEGAADAAVHAPAARSRHHHARHQRHQIRQPLPRLRCLDGHGAAGRDRAEILASCRPTRRRRSSSCRRRRSCRPRMNGSTTCGATPSRSRSSSPSTTPAWRRRRACTSSTRARVAKADPTDGGHLDAANTKAIGTALVPVVKRILGI